METLLQSSRTDERLLQAQRKGHITDPDSTSWDLQEEAEKLGYLTKTDNYWVKYQYTEREVWPGAWSKPERYIGHGL